MTSADKQMKLWLIFFIVVALICIGVNLPNTAKVASPRQVQPKVLTAEHKTAIANLVSAHKYEQALSELIDYKSTESSYIEEIKQQEIIYLVELLKTIPSRLIETNLQHYARLVKLDPSSQRFKDKRDHYQQLVNDKKRQEQEQQELFVQQHGENNLNRYLIKHYLKQIARDPSSVEIINCSSMSGTQVEGKGWAMECSWRARNGFNGLSISNDMFILSNGYMRHFNVPKL